jgi:hypothetical protein
MQEAAAGYSGAVDSHAAMVRRGSLPGFEPLLVKHLMLKRVE